MGRKGPKPQDLTGRKFGRWTVLAGGPTSVNPARWSCTCDCGETAEVLVASLSNGRSQSCGCYHRDQTSAANLKDPDTVARTHLYRKTRVGAAGRGLQFALTFDEWAAIVAGACYLCGDSPRERSIVTSRYQAQDRRYTHSTSVNGVDRRDNSKGYTPDNCSPCCDICNRLKHAHALPVLLAHLEKIVRHQQRNSANAAPQDG